MFIQSEQPKRIKTFPAKEPQRVTPVAASVKVSYNHFDIVEVEE
jgi:hypothetical protein